MGIERRPFQGLANVLRFNWHFYAIAAFGIVIFLFISTNLYNYWKWILVGLALTILITTLISIVTTYYVYDQSKLYELKWLDGLSDKGDKKILNINAGFDETSLIIAKKFKESELHICDFYDPKQHTEISIKRARKAYPPHPKTVIVKTGSLPYSDSQFELVCVTFAAHEIRNLKERKQLFKELRRVTKSNGKIFVTEHLRDVNNFFAYTIGFLHFYSRASWINVFYGSNLNLIGEQKTTPFVTTFILTPNNGTSH